MFLFGGPNPTEAFLSTRKTDIAAITSTYLSQNSKQAHSALSEAIDTLVISYKDSYFASNQKIYQELALLQTELGLKDAPGKLLTQFYELESTLPAACHLVKKAVFNAAITHYQKTILFEYTKCINQLSINKDYVAKLKQIQSAFLTDLNLIIEKQQELIKQRNSVKEKLAQLDPHNDDQRQDLEAEKIKLKNKIRALEAEYQEKEPQATMQLEKMKNAHIELAKRKQQHLLYLQKITEESKLLKKIDNIKSLLSNAHLAALYGEFIKFYDNTHVVQQVTSELDDVSLPQMNLMADSIILEPEAINRKLAQLAQLTPVQQTPVDSNNDNDDDENSAEIKDLESSELVSLYQSVSKEAKTENEQSAANAAYVDMDLLYTKTMRLIDARNHCLTMSFFNKSQAKEQTSVFLRKRLLNGEKTNPHLSDTSPVYASNGLKI